MADSLPTQTVAVFESRHFTVIDGVAEGEGISFADDLLMDDVYRLDIKAERQPLTLQTIDKTGAFQVAPGSAMGFDGHQVVLDSCATFMAPDGKTYEALILVEVVSGGVEAIYLLPLATLIPNVEYRLVGVDRHTATARFAEVACVSFSRGTHITLASGQQMPIENMKVGDRVLTREPNHLARCG